MKQKNDLEILEISVSAAGPWMADISVSAPKKPYQSISNFKSYSLQVETDYFAWR